jgi:GNAT superfamily N-acetyltransferase
MSAFDIKQALTDAEILRVWPVMRVLRPHIESEAVFLVQVRRQQAGSGWQLIYVEDAGAPVAAAGFRVSEWLAWGKALYVDDLICLESHRGQGFAEALMLWMEDHARQQGCAQFHLDSGTHRLGAHRFYHRLKFAVTAFHFQKTL